MTKKSRDALIAEHLDWAHAIARRIAATLPTWFTHDDLTGPAEVALVAMAGKYDPRRHVTFRAFAQRRICGACLDSIRRKEYLEREHAPVAGHEPFSTLPSPEEQAMAAEYYDIWAAVQQLPPRHALVILAFYGADMTLVEIAELVKVGPARLSQIHREALAMLRAAAWGEKEAA